MKKYVKERIFADDGDSRVDLAIKSNSVFYLIDQLVEFFMRVQFIPNQPANLPDQHPNPSDTTYYIIFRFCLFGTSYLPHIFF